MSLFVVSLLKYLHFSRKCRNKDFFEYEALVRNDFTPPKFFNSVCLYGNFMAVANLRKRPFNFLTEYLEHGVCFINTPESARLLGYVDRKFVKTIYTYGPVRKRLIEEYLQKKKLKRNVVSIGPYIKGASNFYSANELKKIKSKYGKILLVYPQHSIEDIKVNYDFWNLVQEINKRKSDFDNVFVCLYWKDILLHPEYVDKYKSEGFVVVSNGHRSDPKFLSRQKDLIELSDMMLTNGLGTHIGYSVCLNKPVYFYHQTVEITNDSSLSTNYQLTDIEALFVQRFGDYSFQIREDQRELVRQYWGEF